MEAERAVLRVMPGDKIEWEVEVVSRSRLRHIWAGFTEEEPGDPNRLQLVLGGEVYRFEKNRRGKCSGSKAPISGSYRTPTG